ncbi:MAG: AraC family transcriptional regulator [Gelidibacter sp.]
MFPDFNLYSTPLLLLSLQGLIFAVLLLRRFFQKRNISDLFLCFILIITCYRETCFTIGFAGWYDTYRNTKINYFLMPLSLAIAPLIYFYVKSITTTKLVFSNKDWWHFLPALLLITYRFSIYFYDASQPGFENTQNGVLKINLDEAIMMPLVEVMAAGQMLLYLAFTFQLFFHYRKKINEYFSNTYNLELNWILSFLVVFTVLFLYDTIQTLVGSLIIDLNYVQRWWLMFFMGLVIIYVGIKGFFTDTTKLKKLDFSFSPQRVTIPDTDEKQDLKAISVEDIEHIKRLMEIDKAYLNPELNLSDLATQANMSRAQLSEIINAGFHKNFNDFVNMYRVEAFKTMIKADKQKQLSLLGMAYECGFNSKATFNRVFKKLTDNSPSQYLQSQSK